MLAAGPTWQILLVAGLYSLGAHGIMTLNDFKAIAGDRATGIRSLPATLGPARAARIAAWTMAVPQAAVIALLLAWERPLHAAVVAVALALQGLAMRRLMTDPEKLAPWFNATGVTLYVLGMLASAVALASMAAP